MWPFRRKKEKSGGRKMVERVVTGVIIGAAISSIIGKTLLEKHEKNEQEDEDDKK